MEKKKRTNKLVWILILLVAAVILVSGYFVLTDWLEDEQTKQSYEVLRQIAAPPAPAGAALMDFTALKEICPDIVGWLTLDDTVIDYPIVQGTDNSYYLNHDPQKKWARAGSLFLDHRLSADFSDPNCIVYGHNMGRGIMLEPLLQFKDEAYFNAHQTGWLYTPEKTFELEIFAVTVSKSTDYPYTWVFASKGEFQGFMEQIKQNAMFQRETDVTWEDQIFTLSTCSYEYNEARTVVFAKMVF